MIPFNLEQALQGKPFGNTEWGKALDIYIVPEKFRAKDKYPVKVLFENTVRSYTTEGRYSEIYPYPERTLQMLPEEKVCWINDYGDNGFGYTHKTLETAIQFAEGKHPTLRITRHHDGNYSIEKVNK